MSGRFITVPSIANKCSPRQNAPGVSGVANGCTIRSNKCITGSIFSEENVEGVFTLNKGLVTNAIDLVNHEIFTERILVEVGKPVWDVFGKYLGRLNEFDPPQQ